VAQAEPRIQNNVSSVVGKIKGKKGTRYVVTPDDVVAALWFLGGAD
jgi:hypothetical protein